VDSDHTRDIEHAQWRVDMVSTLLISHRILPTICEEWRHKEAGYLVRLGAAKSELERVMSGLRPQFITTA